MTTLTQAAIEAARERLAKAAEVDDLTYAPKLHRGGTLDTNYETQALAIALQEMSDAATYGVELLSEGYSREGNEVKSLAPFILPDPVVDPLVEALREVTADGNPATMAAWQKEANTLRAALAARGLQIVPVQS